MHPLAGIAFESGGMVYAISISVQTGQFLTKNLTDRKSVDIQDASKRDVALVQSQLPWH